MTDPKDSSNDFEIEQLPAAENITYELGISYDKEKYKVIHKTLKFKEKKEAKEKSSPIKIYRLFSYFEVIDSDTDQPVEVFDPPLVFRVTYSEDAWYQAIENDETYGRPRVAYLVWKRIGNKWAEDWIEFTEEEIADVIKPGTAGDPNGYLEITVLAFGDPLIGGC